MDDLLGRGPPRAPAAARSTRAGAGRPRAGSARPPSGRSSVPRSRRTPGPARTRRRRGRSGRRAPVPSRMSKPVTRTPPSNATPFASRLRPERSRHANALRDPVGRHEVGAEDVIGIEDRDPLGGLLGREELGSLDPVRLRVPASTLQLLDPLGRGRDLDAADPVPGGLALGLEPRVQVHRVLGQPAHRPRPVRLEHEARRVGGRAPRLEQRSLIEDEDVGDAELREVVRGARAHDPGADHHELRPILHAEADTIERPSALRVLVGHELPAPQRHDHALQHALDVLAPGVERLRPADPEAASRLVDVAVESHERLVPLDRLADRHAPAAGRDEPAALPDRPRQLTGPHLELEARVDRGVLRRAVEVEHAAPDVGHRRPPPRRSPARSPPRSPPAACPRACTSTGRP